MDSSNKKRREAIKYYLFYADRQEDEIEVLDRLGLMHNAVIPLNVYAWDCLQKIYVLTPEIYRSLREGGESKGSRNNWAVKMLKSKKGLNKIAQNLDDSKTRKIAQGILTIGYPEMREEVAGILKTSNKLDSLEYLPF